MNQKEKILKAIIIIGSKFLGRDIKWLIGGSGSLLVHGLDVVPNDIDVVVDSENYNEVLTVLKVILVGETKVNGNTIKTPFRIGDINGELLAHDIDRDLLTVVNIDGVSIPVYKLEVEYNFYKKRTDNIEKNKKKIKLIEKALLSGILTRKE